MIISIETTSKNLAELVDAQTEHKAISMKKNDVKYSVLLQNPSENDVFIDSFMEPTSTTGIILAAGAQMSLDIYELDDVHFIAGSNTDLRVMFL